MPLYANCDSLCQLLGVVDEEGNYLTETGTPITCAVTDESGAPVATVSLAYMGQPVTIGNRVFADGNWSGLLPASVSLIVGASYTLTFQCQNPAFQFVRYETAQTRLA